MAVLLKHRQWFVESFGERCADQAVFPFGSPQPTDPDRCETDISSGWDLIRERSRVSCRLHDLRHTFATQLTENGTSESTMLALRGHMSRAMLETVRSHSNEREAVEAVTLRPMKKKALSKVAPLKIPMGVRSREVN